MNILAIVTPFLDTEPENSSKKNGDKKQETGELYDTLRAQLSDAKGIKIAHQLFGADISAEIALATAVVFNVNTVMKQLRNRPKIQQTEAYWMVDVWGRTQALKALVVDFARIMDSGQPSGFTTSGFCSRVAVLSVGCHELIALVCQNLMPEVPKSLVSLASKVKSAQSAAKLAIEAHITNL